MEQFSQQIRLYSNKKSVKYGIPFLILILGGSFGLKHFTQLRYLYSKKKQLTPAEAEKFGVSMKNTGDVTLETEYEKIKDIHLDDYEMVRGPRPWEENLNQ